MKFLAAMVLAAGAVATTASAMQVQAPARTGWQMDWGAQYCTLIRLPDDAVPYTIGLRQIPGSEHPDIVVRAAGSAHLPNDVSSVALGPQGPSYPVRMDMEDHPSGRLMVVRNLPFNFWEDFARAGELQLNRGETVVLRAPLANPAGAATALQECMSDGMRAWEIDPAALRSLTRWPRSVNNYGLSDRDYPTSLLDDGAQGRTVIRLKVEANGRASECTTVATSGERAFDERACSVILNRARFDPGLGPDGQAVAVRYVETVLWLSSEG